eukprot:CAMPEP_0172212912 /NCGR_PEP_ID=MMETSP1050-20130122/37296_1 /TAXON_ID=233186 /ORGANISM="Cryptomonas curvata, Strain CCAP979/52" /LENGTH=254 /DNA_ID=CAMNT_0012893677 /DNA_START=199 /DNA_END=964 /DNA_ORIENTATION=+
MKKKPPKSLQIGKCTHELALCRIPKSMRWSCAGVGSIDRVTLGSGAARADACCAVGRVARRAFPADQRETGAAGPHAARAAKRRAGHEPENEVPGGIVNLRAPIATMVLHYDQSQSNMCEATGLIEPNRAVPAANGGGSGGESSGANGANGANGAYGGGARAGGVPGAVADGGAGVAELLPAAQGLLRRVLRGAHRLLLSRTLCSKPYVTAQPREYVSAANTACSSSRETRQQQHQRRCWWSHVDHYLQTRVLL